MSVAAPPLPSHNDLLRELRANMPAMYLHNAGPEWFRLTFSSREYWMPPTLDGEPLVEHPVTGYQVKADGTLAVRDAYGPTRNDQGRPNGVNPLKGHDAVSLIKYALEKYQKRGITWLQGNHTDEARKAAARKAYYKHIETWARQEVDARAEFVRKWQDQPNNKGRVPPPPKPTQVRAQEILDAGRDDKRSGAEFICKFGCYETSDAEKFARHMRVNHAEVWAPPVLEESRATKKAAR